MRTPMTPTRAKLCCNATHVVSEHPTTLIEFVDGPIRHAFCTLEYEHAGDHLDHLGNEWQAVRDDRRGVWAWEQLGEAARAVAAQ